MNDADNILFIIAIVPSIIILLAGLCRMFIAKKHDKVLFRFCQVRRDLMTFLRDPELNIDATTYLKSRETLAIVSSIIHHYSSYKKAMFNLRLSLEGYNKANHEVEALKRTGNAELDKINQDLRRSLVESALELTPFFRSRILFALLRIYWQVRKENSLIESASNLMDESARLGLSH